MISRVPAQRIKLANKAVLLVEENHSVPLVSLCAYFGGSIRSEDLAQSGVTYFTQKVLPKGSQKYSAEDFAFRTERLGSSPVFFTEKDNFGAYTTVLSKHFDEALELFAETLSRPVFPPDEIEKEREVILAEIEEGREDIYAYSQELCDRALFRSHPYRLPLKGEVESVKSLNRSHLADWHARWFVPNNLVFSIVGDASARHMIEKAAEALEKFPTSKLKRVQPAPENADGTRSLEARREKHQLALALGFLAPPAGSDERFVFEVLNGLLSGMGARLFIELRDKKGLAYSIGSRYDALLDHGILKAYIGTAAGREEAAKEGLLEEILKLRSETAGPEELERTKRHLIGLYEISRQKSHVRALRYARYEMLGLGWRTANLYPKKIEAVQAEQVREAAQRHLRGDNYSLAVVRPAAARLSA